MNSTLENHKQNPFYKREKEFREYMERQQTIKGFEEYPEPFNPASWSNEELIEHAMAENVYQSRYIYGMYERMQVQEQEIQYLRLLLKEFDNEEARKSPLSLNEYQLRSKRTMPKEFHELAKCNYAMGLSGESGEVVDLLKKHIHHGHELEDDSKLVKELGDVLHYLAGIATMFGFSLEEVGAANLKKLAERYPDGFSQEASKNRGDSE